MQTEKFKYLWLKVLSWTDLGTLEIKERTLTQHDDSVDTDYKTEYEYTTTQTNYHADFHRPTSIKETGTAAGDRTTEYTYLHLSSPFVVGLVVEETTTVDTGASSESFIKSAEFDTLGFKTSETVYGITSTFARYSSGNVAWAEKGNGKRTTFTYERGQVKVTQTPEYSITRTINPDGTIATETRGGRLTAFDYDALGRLTEVQPPGTLPITLTYDEAARTVTITRGGNSQVSSAAEFRQRAQPG
jgi:YD repeat-containing protein